MQDRPVYVVSDRPDRASRLARGIALLMPCRTIAAGAPLPRGEPVAWVIDLDLERVAETAWFEALRSRLDADSTCCLYLARDGGARESAALVALLGSPTPVPAKLGADGVVTVLMRAIERAKQRSGVTRLGSKLATATTLVDAIFSAAAQGAAPRPDEADNGTEIVLEAVSEVGIREWLFTIWRHDITVYQHSLSVAGCAAAFAAVLGFSHVDRHRLVKAALLHDVGKSRTPLAILNKPGSLSAVEMETMRAHAAVGGELLAASGDFDQSMIDVARWHHERLDGSGYPDGLTGNAIDDLVRLVAICDVHSALTERRVYRPPLSASQAGVIMDSMMGQLDSDLLRAYRPIIECANPLPAA